MGIHHESRRIPHSLSSNGDFHVTFVLDLKLKAHDKGSRDQAPRLGEKDYVCGPRRIVTQTDPAATISTMKVALALSLVASAAAFSQVSRSRGDGQIYVVKELESA